MRFQDFAYMWSTNNRPDIVFCEKSVQNAKTWSGKTAQTLYFPDKAGMLENLVTIFLHSPLVVGDESTNCFADTSLT